MPVLSISKAALLVGCVLMAGCSLALEKPHEPRLRQVPRLQIVDPDSEEFQSEMTAELKAARQVAQNSKPVVTRRFGIGWEIHQGFFLVPEGNAEEMVTLDFADEQVRQQFSDFVPIAGPHQNAGKRIMCECSGVEWSFYSDKRFIVQSAKLEAM